MRVAFVEWPDGLEPFGDAWDGIRAQMSSHKPDILITNELPFGPWLAASAQFDKDAAQRSVDLHQRGRQALAELEVGAILTSRPVWSGDRLANEAVLLTGVAEHILHRKHYLPDEDGWRETRWFEPGVSEFGLAACDGIQIGTLLCTELMFNEHARHYGRHGAHLIAVPRASDGLNPLWKTAGAMAAFVSGSYVISSNRSGAPCFGGGGFAFAPNGELLGMTSAQTPIVIVDLDPAFAERQRLCYPCYVDE